MRMQALGLMVLVAVFVVAGKPLAQPAAEEPVIPMPIIQDNGPGTQTVLAAAPPPGDRPGLPTTGADPKVPAPGLQSGSDNGGPYGAIKQPSTAFQVCYLFQSEEGKPASVVIWRAIGEGAKFDPREVRERMLLQNPQALAGKGVYVLQDDYHAQRVSLTAQETSHVVELLQKNTDGKVLTGDATWKAKVAPSLKVVEYEAERSKELRKLAAQRAREAKRTVKSGSPSKAPDAKAGPPAKVQSSAKSASASHRSHSHGSAVRVAQVHAHRAGKALARW
jgi:hypothetical protein